MWWRHVHCQVGPVGVAQYVTTPGGHTYAAQTLPMVLPAGVAGTSHQATYPVQQWTSGQGPPPQQWSYQGPLGAVGGQSYDEQRQPTKQGTVSSPYNMTQLYYTISHTVLTHWGRENGRPFPDDIFKCIFLNEDIWISIEFSLKFVPKGPIDNIPALVQLMAWRRPGDKPLSEPMMVVLSTHICVTQPQWVIKIHGHVEVRIRNKKAPLQVRYGTPTSKAYCYFWFVYFGCQLDEPYGFPGDH